MVKKCSVLKCSHERNAKFSLFKLPNDENIKTLCCTIVSQKNNKVTDIKFVCELHFKKSEIIRSYSPLIPHTTW